MKKDKKYSLFIFCKNCKRKFEIKILKGFIFGQENKVYGGKPLECPNCGLRENSLRLKILRNRKEAICFEFIHFENLGSKRMRK